ncbi:MAG TPA: cytochrome c-type biogenesis protein CcmH [Terriglobales bacterium]|nr:cytochrome c-type biogenesis protein CcmH [Terriglobales bacterium]
MKRFRQLATAFLTIAFAISLLGASGERARFTDLGHRMMCVCGCNQILLECNHVGCPYSDRMREQLLSAVQKNSSDDEVLQSFVREYGNTVLAAPTGRGFDRLAWIMPFAVFFGGSFTAAMLVRNWKGRPPSPPTGSTPSALDRYREKARKETEL